MATPRTSVSHVLLKEEGQFIQFSTTIVKSRWHWSRLRGTRLSGARLISFSLSRWIPTTPRCLKRKVGFRPVASRARIRQHRPAAHQNRPTTPCPVHEYQLSSAGGKVGTRTVTHVTVLTIRGVRAARRVKTYFSGSVCCATSVFSRPRRSCSLRPRNCGAPPVSVEQPETAP